MLCSRVMARFAYLECHCSLFRTVRSETCPCSVATLLSSQLCTRTLAIGSCKSDKRAAKLNLASCTYVQHAVITDGHAHLRIQNFFLATITAIISHFLYSGKLLSLAEQVSYCKRLASCGIASVPPPRRGIASVLPPRHQHPWCFLEYSVVGSLCRIKNCKFSHGKGAVGVAKSTTEANQVVIKANCISQLIKR